MRLVSLNVGRPALVLHDGKRYSTAINRRPAEQPIQLTRAGFIQDRVADHENHGGPDRAACCYAHEHYDFWADRLNRALPVPSFGENLTTAGMLERDMCIGDALRLGGAVVQISQPRQPCWKLANKLGVPDVLKWITERAFTGFYVRVLEEGMVRPGDVLELLDRPNPQVTVELTALTLLTEQGDREVVARLAHLKDLSEGWRARAARRLPPASSPRNT